MIAEDSRSTTGKDESPGCGAFVLKWIVAFVLPALLLLGVRQHFAAREAARDRVRQEEQWRRQLQNVKPEEMGPATRMLLGIEDADRAAGGVANEPAAATDDQQLIAPKHTVDCGNPQG